METPEPTFALYMEIVEFLHSGGGPYRAMDGDVQEHLIEALYSGQYVLQRDERGEIVAFCDYWLIHPEDLELIKQGGEPEDKSSGSVLFVVDCVNKGGRQSFMGMVGELRRRCHQGERGAAWFHKRALPEMFRHYPSQRGKHGKEERST